MWLDQEEEDETEQNQRQSLRRWVVLGLALAILVPTGWWWAMSRSQQTVRTDPVRVDTGGDEFAAARRFWQALQNRDHAAMRQFLEERRDAGTASTLEQVALGALYQDAGLIDASGAVLARVLATQPKLDVQSRTVLARQAFLEGKVDLAVAEMVAAVQAEPRLLAEREGRPRTFIMELVMDLARRGRPQDVLDLLPRSVLEEDRTLHPFAINAGLAVRDQDLVMLLLTSPLSPFQGIARERVLASAYDVFGQPDEAEPHYQEAWRLAVENGHATELKLLGSTALARGRFALARRAFAASLDHGGAGFFGAGDLDRYAWSILRSSTAAEAGDELAYLSRRFPEVVSFQVAGDYAKVLENRLAQLPAADGLALQGTWAEIRAATEAWLLLPDHAEAALAILSPWHQPGRNPDPAVAVAYICSLASVGRTAEAYQLHQALSPLAVSPIEQDRLAQFLALP